MGAVGLSFGNPTSGTGFDVSTTVSEIMASYQAVETPWNTQLTALSAEDAAFTTIGTALSDLSTAAFALTNFEGVLASMEGSSSDPEVLDLSSASTSAVAGTYSVAVQTMAQTDTWSTSATPTPANATLSGNISIAVGTGAATTFDIGSSDDTLATLAQTINSAGIGVTAEVLSNANGSYLSLISGTSGSSGTLKIDTTAGGITPALTANGTALPFTNTVTGGDAVMVVDGSTVTSSSNTVTTAIPGVTFQILNTSANTSVQVVIANDTADIGSAMENFVSAYNAVMTDLNTQEGTSAAGTDEPLFGNPMIAQLQQQLSQVMNQSQNNVWDSSSDSISPTATLSGTITIGATSITLDSSDDTLATLAAQINGNSSLGVTASVLTNTTGSYLSLVSQNPGTAGDLTVTGGFTTSTGSPVNFSDTNVGSSISQFSALGISSVTDDNGTFSANAGGLLSINSTTLNNALSSDFQAVVNFFQDAAGIGTTFGNLITNLGSASSTGVVTEALNQDSAEESTLNADITNENAIIASQQASLTTELEDANETLQAIPSQISEVNELYAAITGYGETQS
jgi:flagellar hook-associated protein 2